MLAPPGRGWIGHPRAGSGGRQRSLVAQRGHAAADGLAVLREKSVHAALHLVAARRGTGKNLRYQNARGSPMSACWFRRRAAQSRAPHRGSVCRVENRLAWLRLPAFPERSPPNYPPRLLAARAIAKALPTHAAEPITTSGL